MLVQEPGPRRHLRDLGRAGRRRARGVARQRQHQDQDRHARSRRAGGARHGQGRQRHRHLVADKAYELGRTMAAVGVKALLEQETPPFLVAPALTVTKENVAARLAGFAQSRARRSRCSMRRSRSRPQGSGSAMPEPPQPRTEIATMLKTTATLALLATLAGTPAPLPRRRHHRTRTARAPTPARSLTLTPAEEQQIKDGKFTAALVWHEMSEYTNAVNRGAQDEFKRLGIAVVAQTDAGFDAARQKSDVETVLAKKPSIILSLPVDPASAASVYDPARDAGVKLAFVDNSPAGYEQGTRLCRDRLRRSLPDGQQGRHRHGRGARQEGQGRLHLPRRRFLRHQPARRRLQDDDRGRTIRT